MLDRRQRRGAGATIMTGDDDVIGLGFSHTGGDCTDTNFRHQLDRDGSFWINVFQIMDQLRQIFDRINIVMRRRRNQADTRHRETQLGDVIGDFMSRQLTTFARLGALRHLDLNLFSRSQVFGGNTKTTGRNLFDFRAQRIASQQRHVDFNQFFTNDGSECIADLDWNTAQFVAITIFVFAAFARIRLAADTVHRNGQRGMRFGRDRTERHGAGGKTFDDFLGRLNFIERDGFGRVDFEFKQTAQSHMTLGLIINDLRIFFVGAEVI